jgi:hypothetical protein
MAWIAGLTFPPLLAQFSGPFYGLSLIASGLAPLAESKRIFFNGTCLEMLGSVSGARGAFEANGTMQKLSEYDTLFARNEAGGPWARAHDDSIGHRTGHPHNPVRKPLPV